MSTRDIPYLWRLRLIQFVLALLASVVVGRIIFLHMMEVDFLQKQGDARSLREVAIPAHRGMILDRNGEPLAVSAPVQSLWIDPREFIVTESETKGLAQRLGMSLNSLRSILARGDGRKFLYLKRNMTPAAAEAVLALQLPGLYASDDYRRYYPAGEVATHLVGFTNVDGKGQEGLELAFDQWLEGKPGSKRVLKDRLGRTIKDIQALDVARPGNDLTLSIDLRLQYLAYRELKAAVQQHRAKSGSLVALDARTGEVLAMVSQPSYNPNDRSTLNIDALRNRATTDTFEPGSTVKPLTVAAALASGRFGLSSTVDTSPGFLRIRNATIRDHRDYGVLDLAHIISKSSNVGASKLALEMDSDTVRNLFYNAGLGQATGTGFPGERVGTLPQFSPKRTVERAALSYGYGLAVTPLQLAQAYLPFANGGLKRQLSLLKVDEPMPAERVLPATAADAVLQMMEGVTLEGGTGTRAQVPSYRVAGKTGTSHKVGGGGYEEDQYVAVFAGVAPLNNPRVVMVVMIDEPQGEKYYGGEVAAPVFSRVMAGTLRLLNIAPDKMPLPLNQQFAWNGES